MLRLVMFAATALVAAASAAAAETLVERGDYLVNAVMACDGCHTPRTPAGFVMEKRFSGGSQVWDEAAYTVRGPNITSDRETGIGSWKDADLKRALVEGMRPSGVPLVPQMPFPFYRILTPRDADALVAYIRTAASVQHEVPPPVYKAAVKVPVIPGAEGPISDEALKDPVKRGFYLATLAHCMECHARRPDGVQDYKGWWGTGGHEMKGPFGSVTVRNITSHKERGIGAWSDAEIKRALTEGVGRDGRHFKLPMARQIYFSKMTEDDLNAIVAWVRTIPPQE
jgi:mono/diheme cytochrome c family protein